tara:strand:- start:1368 stop:1877 length:510 start_codon:yes stop_codon:yes gene_type:complete
MTTQITARLMKDIREPIETALAAVSEQFGVELKLGRGSYADEYADFKLKLNLVSETGDVQTKESHAYKTFAGEKWSDLEGFNPDWLFMEFEYARETFKLLGYKTRARKNNIALLRISNNDHVVASAKNILRALQSQFGVYEAPEDLNSGNLTLTPPPTVTDLSDYFPNK